MNGWLFRIVVLEMMMSGESLFVVLEQPAVVPLLGGLSGTQCEWMVIL
jgi:hypothetical protein